MKKSLFFGILFFFIILLGVGVSAGGAEPYVFSMTCKVDACSRIFNTPEGRAQGTVWFRSHGISKLYLESYRHGEHVEESVLREEKAAFEAEGFTVGGCITTTMMNESRSLVCCFSDPKACDFLQREVEKAAQIFDFIILDDFLFTTCTCERCQKMRGDRSWSEFRRELMLDVSRRFILEPAKRVNPKCKIIIKYPCWYDNYGENGYDIVRESEIYGACWVGTETRDAGIPTQACWLQSWMNAAAGKKCGGCWYDPLETSPETFVEQARYSILGGARESLLHCYDYLAADDPGKAVLTGDPNVKNGHADADAFLREQEGLQLLAEILQNAVPYGIQCPKQANVHAVTNEKFGPRLMLTGLPVVAACRLDSDENSRFPSAISCEALFPELANVLRAQFTDTQNVKNVKNVKTPILLTRDAWLTLPADVQQMLAPKAPEFPEKSVFALDVNENLTLLSGGSHLDDTLSDADLAALRKKFLAPLGITLEGPTRVSTHLFEKKKEKCAENRTEYLEAFQNLRGEPVTLKVTFSGEKAGRRFKRTALPTPESAKIQELGKDSYEIQIAPHSFVLISNESGFFETFRHAPKRFTVMPFWFWNDVLDDAEIVRQIADFEAHGVYGFVIHPRIGLPEDTGWMSPKLLSAMRAALTEARRRGMYVLLYDEGMYPSGSSAGQVAARNPRFAARGLFCVPLKDGEEPQAKPKPLWELICVQKRAEGVRVAIYERPSGGRIRGLHYIGEGTPRLQEFLPPAGDILAPEAVACFRELVYDRYFTEFSEFFGNTVIGIFTDEPSELGRGADRDVVPGNAQAIQRISARLGYDFTPFLSELWYADTLDAAKHRHDYYQALHQDLVSTYYRTLSDWCASHGVALCGHPGRSNDMASEAVFQIPGQDIVWRYVEPGEKALAGGDSTNAKAASSAMTHFGRERNLNELYGAYGHNLTFEEVRWLANWVLIRGQNLLVPHAFYYSVRGPRHEERPPDVGPHSAWWNEGFREYADACRRISWLNSGVPVIRVAVLTDGVSLKDVPVRPLFENQLDFNYLEMEQLLRDGTVTDSGLKIAGMTYSAVILPDSSDAVPAGFYDSEVMKLLDAAGRLVRWTPNDVPGYVETIQKLVHNSNSMPGTAPVPAIIGVNPSGIRMRCVELEGMLCVMLFNETETPAEITLQNLPAGPYFWLDAETGDASECVSVERIPFGKYEIKILAVKW